MAKGISTSAVFGMVCFDHHRAEITVMQFTGHPLPVHQFVTVRWDCQPISPTPMEYATSAVLWIACLVGLEVNILSIWNQEPTGSNISILVSMSLSPINLKCWILQNVMLYFVCEIMLKLCVLNVKTRLLYYKAKLMLDFPHVRKQGRMFLNVFYRIILKFVKKALTVI